MGGLRSEAEFVESSRSSSMSFSLEKATQLLADSHAQGRLSHAYLITGPEGSGKRALAKSIMGMVNGVELGEDVTIESLRSSTTSVVRPESKSRRISVAAMREAEHTLHMAAPAGVTKFAVIMEADRMGVEAENAFLKTLEEPPGASMLILITANHELLLDTILSRCIRVPLTGNTGPMELDENARKLLDALREHTLSGAKSVSAALGLMAEFSRILKAEKAVIGERNEAAAKAESAHYKQTTDASDWLKKREDHYKAITESEYLRSRNRFIEYLVTWFGDALRQQHGATHLDLPDYADGTGKLANSLSINQLSKKIDAVEELRSNLNTNVQEILALEAGFIKAFG